MQTHVSPPPPVGALRDDGSVDDAHAGVLADELAVALYEQMVLARAFDERLVALQREGRIAQPLERRRRRGGHRGRGRRAARRGLGLPRVARVRRGALARDAARGVRAPRSSARRATRARAATLHAPPFWKPARVGERQPAVGRPRSPTPSASRGRPGREKDDVAALVFFGDGATSSGDFHTGLNFAGVTRAPVVAVCRNNGWATSTPASAPDRERRVRREGRRLRPARRARRRRRRRRRPRRRARGARAGVGRRGRRRSSRP